MKLLSAISAYGQVFNSQTWIIVLVSMCTVILSLLIFYFFSRYALPRILNFKLKNFVRNKRISPAEVNTKTMVSGEVNAAIAMALYLYYNESHDMESGIVTIKRVSKNYSPWSSKLYNMKNL